jgi:hypothetical protein
MMFLSNLLGSFVSLLAKVGVFTAVIVAARGAGVYSQETFFHLLFGGGAAITAEHLARGNWHLVWGLLKARPAPVIVLQLLVLVGVFLFACCILLTIELTAIELFVGPIPAASHGWLVPSARVRLGLGLITLGGTLAVAIYLWFSRTSKIAMLDATSDAVKEVTSALARIDSAYTVAHVRREGNVACGRLIDRMLERRGLFRSRAKSLRAGFVLLPDVDNFYVDVMFPSHMQYAELPALLHPSRWRPAMVEALREELAAARREKTGPTLAAAEADIRARREACSSITGYAFVYGGLHVYPDVTAEFFRSEGYTAAFPPAERDALSFRSKAAIRLQCDERVLGVLLLTDTAVGGFLNADKSPIEHLTPLIAMIVDRVGRRVQELGG